jgi:DNA polymerase III subunit delta'
VPLSPLFGHSALRNRFDAAIARGALPGSLLLHGPAGVGKQRLALWLGQRLLCSGNAKHPCGECQNCRYVLAGTHPDLHWIFPRPRLKDSDPSVADVEADYTDAIAERLEANGLYAPPSGSEGIFIATIRAVVHAASLAPAMAHRKVFVIGDADRMVSQEGADQAANAFLKLLEEPPDNTNLILTSSEPGALLPTIRSRVIAARVPRLADAEMREFLSDANVRAHVKKLDLGGDDDTLLRLAHGAPGAILAQSATSGALERARRILDAAAGPDRAERFRTALVQGSARARGEFSAALDALTLLLHQRAQAAVAHQDGRAALGAARAVEAVERAKESAQGNANPQLVTITLIRELEAALR